MKLHIEPTTIKHLLDFLQNVRPLDIQEAELEGIKFTDLPLSEFDNCQSLVDEDDNVFVIGGVVADMDGYGMVWMLCTTRVEQHKIAFLRYTKKLLKSTLGYYTRIGNKAWVENKLHIDWLTWMGADWCEKTDDPRFRYFSFKDKEAQ